MRIVLLLGLCSLLIAADAPDVDRHVPLRLPKWLLSELQSGDLIFREGTELVSNVVMNVDGSGYSHVGLLLYQEQEWHVIHAVPAERRDRSDEVVLDTLDFFIAPSRARNIAVYRVAADPLIRQKATDYAMQRLGIPFRLDTDEGTYCTHLIDESYKQADFSLDAHYQYLNIPLLNGYYLLPSTLRTSPHLMLVYASRPSP